LGISAGAVKNLKWELSGHDICEDDLLPVTGCPLRE
jgi:hypothetical protein